MINEKIKVTGNVQLIHYDSAGFIKNQQNIKNLVVTSGKNFIASRLIGASSAIMSHMAVGTDAAQSSVTHTSLFSEVSRVALDSSTNLNNVATYNATFTFTGVFSLVEAAIFNAPVGGTMLCRTVFPVVNILANDILFIQWDLTIS